MLCYDKDVKRYIQLTQVIAFLSCVISQLNDFNELNNDSDCKKLRCHGK